MWKNFIRVTIRSINKNKAFNAINIAGLAIGLASAIFIILYILSETSFDRFNKQAANIYRLYLNGKMAGEEFKGAWNSPIFGPTFYEEIPEIENYCRFDFADNLFERYRHRILSMGGQHNAVFAFSDSGSAGRTQARSKYPVLRGRRATSLKIPENCDSGFEPR